MLSISLGEAIDILPVATFTGICVFGDVSEEAGLPLLKNEAISICFEVVSGCQPRCQRKCCCNIAPHVCKWLGPVNGIIYGIAEGIDREASCSGEDSVSVGHAEL